MDIDVTFDDHGDQRRLEQLALFLQDLRPFWPLVVPLATGWWRRQFETEGRFAGDGWAPLTPAYQIRKERLYPGKPILQATGDMKRAVSNPSRAVTPLSLTLTVEDPKLEYHQDGTDRMPARPVIFGDPLPALAEAELQDAANEYVSDLLRRL